MKTNPWRLGVFLLYIVQTVSVWYDITRTIFQNAVFEDIKSIVLLLL